MIITSLKNKQIIEACALKEKKYRDRENKFLIEGYHLIEMCDTIEQIFTTNLNFNSKYPVTYVSEQVMEKLSFTKSPQGIIAIDNKKENKIDLNKEKYLICDNVSDPGNLGTIIRTALAFKIDGVVLSKNCTDVYNDKVIRGSQGAIFKVDFVYADLLSIISELKKNNVTIYASALLDNSIDLQNVKNISKFALIVGNEGSGVEPQILSCSDKIIKIMHNHEIDSLNVGVATSIMLYYFVNNLK